MVILIYRTEPHKRQNKKSQNNLGKAASPPFTQKIPRLQWDAPHLGLPFPPTIYTPSNTLIPRLIPLTIQNGIRIQSAALPQYTFRTDRQTDKKTDRPTDGIGDNSPRALNYTVLY